MPLAANSTLADFEAAYDANADYDVSSSVAKCQAFVQACRVLLRRRPVSAKRSTGAGSTHAEFDSANLKAELDRALQWLHFSGVAPDAVVFPSFMESRDYDSGFSGGFPLQQPYGDQQV